MRRLQGGHGWYDPMSIHQRGDTIFVVEQNATMTLSIADRGSVLQTGQIALADTADALPDNEQMRAAYLGEL